MDATLGRRIAVVGTTGCGKTTLAGQLEQDLGIQHVELDALYWGSHWTPATLEDFCARVGQVVCRDEWVLDGNYSRVRDLIWARTQTLIWLDYSLPVVLYRLSMRTFKRVFTRQVLWNGNRETVKSAFFEQDSLFRWVLRTHRPRRQQFEAALQKPEYAHMNVIRHHSPHETLLWLANPAIRSHFNGTRTQS
ncbi:MAG TPA: adenylate kinase [Anaerolineae bacterium]